jgi:hypothetical protein
MVHVIQKPDDQLRWLISQMVWEGEEEGHLFKARIVRAEPHNYEGRKDSENDFRKSILDGLKESIDRILYMINSVLGDNRTDADKQVLNDLHKTIWGSGYDFDRINEKCRSDLRTLAGRCKGLKGGVNVIDVVQYLFVQLDEVQPYFE